MIDDGRLAAAGPGGHGVAADDDGRLAASGGQGRQAGGRVTGPADGARGPATGTGRREGGFTLLEIMVVIVILGLLIGLVAPAVLRQLGSARTSIARQSLTQLGSVLDLYKLDAGRYPSSAEGLQALVTAPADAANWNGPYVQGGKMPVDPWNHEYVYREPSTRPGHEYDLCSRGPDAQAASDGPGLICNE